MITQRPTIGSRRSSGTSDLRHVEGQPELYGRTAGLEPQVPDGGKDRALVGTLETSFGLGRGLQRKAPERGRRLTTGGLERDSEATPLVDQVDAAAAVPSAC